MPANTEENRENRRQDNRSPERYSNPELCSKKTRVLDSRPLNSALYQTNTQGYRDAPTVCRAVPCSLRQLIVALIRPLSREGRADGGSNTEALHGVTISLPCQDDADKKYWKLLI